MSDRRSSWPGFLFTLLIAMILGVSAGACQQQRDRSRILTAVPTTDLRFTGTKTGVGDFTIKVPQPFVIDSESNPTSDVYFFTDVADTGEVQKGMIYLSIAVKPLVFIPDSVDDDKTGGTIAGESVTWRETTALTPAGKTLYQREAIARDLLKMNPSPGTKGSFILQAFVVGTDSVLVERLMAAVETIRSVPKANL